MARDTAAAMSQPPRFTIERASIKAGAVRIGGAELHHLRDVRRLAAGSEITLIDEAGQIYAGRIERYEPDCAMVAIAPLGPCGPRMDLLVEKAAELGAAELIPLLTTRSAARQAGAQRVERWGRIATSAVKQSLAPRRMTIRDPIAVAQFVSDLPQDTLAVMCLIDAPPLGALIREARPRRILLACGPEGGFDADEIALMRDAEFRAAALGPNRLRSETAALAALSIAAGAIFEIAGRN
jgi:16S rRNA (uracil1498-N3)-methyltransferase